MKVSMFADGSLHGTIPAPDWEWGHKCGPVCDGILYEIPHRVYLYTGKTEMLSDGIPYFERYIEFLEKKLSEDHEFILGDWMGGSALVSKVPKRFVADLYLLKAYDITALAHRVTNTGNTVWEKKRGAWRRALAEKYLESDGSYRIGEQTVVAMLIEMQVGDSKEKLARQLASIVARDGYQLRAGMVGVQYIYHALSEIGRADLAYRLLDETRPGYRSWFEKGESTLWERWDGEDVGSHNHHMYSNVVSWFFNSLLGIVPTEDAPGFEEVTLRPRFVREIGYAKGFEETVRGRI
jgi:alpha-L-rhamnosidase